MKPWGLSRPDAEREENGELEDELTHVFCICDINRALCGADLSNDEIVNEWDESNECIVCLDLDGTPCERCGQC